MAYQQKGKTSSDFVLFAKSDKGKQGKNKKFKDYRNAPIIRTSKIGLFKA